MRLFGAVLLVVGFALANASPRITNGIEAPENFAPHHAHLNIKRDDDDATYVGSGTLITDHHVLTTATNTDGFNLWKVGLGNHNREDLEWHETEEAETHPDYDPSTLNNNLAILILPEPIEESPEIAPATMPNNFQALLPGANDRGRVTGFGYIDDGEFANALKVGFQNVISIEDCAEHWPHIEEFEENVFCTSSEDSNICAGDQGSGITVQPGFVNILVGIASFTSSECDHDTPAVFIRINTYREWIEEVTEVEW